MSKMMRSDRKPPLAMRSPIRLRPRRGAQTTTVKNLQTPSAHFTKSCLPKQQSLDMEEPELRPEYHTISSELRALTKMVQDNLRGSIDTDQPPNASNGTPLFERGRFYDEYAARRNERLRSKRGEFGVEKKSPCKQYLGVKTESTKRTAEVKKFESAKKMSVATPLVERREAAVAAMTTQRYSLRSSVKENKKPPLAMSFDRSIGGTVEKKTAMKRTARKGY